MGETIILMAILLRKKLEVKDTSFHLLPRELGKFPSSKGRL